MSMVGKTLVASALSPPKSPPAGAAKQPLIEDGRTPREDLSRSIATDIARFDSQLKPLYEKADAIESRTRLKGQIAKLGAEQKEVNKDITSILESTHRRFNQEHESQKRKAIELIETLAANPVTKFGQLATQSELDVPVLSMALEILRRLHNDASSRRLMPAQRVSDPWPGALGYAVNSIVRNLDAITGVSGASEMSTTLGGLTVGVASNRIQEISEFLGKLPSGNKDTGLKVDGLTIEQALDKNETLIELLRKKGRLETQMKALKAELVGANAVYEECKVAFLAEQKRYAISQADNHNRAIRPFIWVTDGIGSLVMMAGIPVAFWNLLMGGGIMIAGAGFALVTRLTRRAKPKVEDLTDNEIATRILQTIKTVEIEPLECEKAQLVQSQLRLLASETGTGQNQE